MHGYSHLLTGAARDLECASCLHVDDIGKEINVDVIMDIASAFFDEIGESPRVVDYQFSHEREHRRSPVSTFRKHISQKGHSVGATLSSVTIRGDGFEGDAISNTWTPRSVVSVVLHGRVMEAFLQTPRYTDKEIRYLTELPFRMFEASFAAAYIFPFPLAFSPLAYSSGISYSPNSKMLGCLSDRDSERVTNWANHCYRGHRAAEGFLRDIYPLNIIGAEHMKMDIGKLNLGNWIKLDSRRGNVTELHGKFLWSVDSSNLTTLQSDLDNAGILLANFPPS